MLEESHFTCRLRYILQHTNLQRCYKIILQVHTLGTLVYTASPQEDPVVNLIHILQNMQLCWAKTNCELLSSEFYAMLKD